MFCTNVRCNEGYELWLPDDERGITETTLVCVEGETYSPPEIPECFESEFFHLASAAIFTAALFYSFNFVHATRLC